MTPPQLRDDRALPDPRGPGEHGQPGELPHGKAVSTAIPRGSAGGGGVAWVSSGPVGHAPAPAPGFRGVRLRSGSEARAELVLERRALVRPQTAHPAGLSDAEPLHDLLGANLADAGHRLEQSRDLHLANDVIGGAFLDDVGQSGGSALEAILHLGAFFACSGGLLQGCRALIRSEGGKSHSRSPRVSLGKTLWR